MSSIDSGCTHRGNEVLSPRALTDQAIVIQNNALTHTEWISFEIDWVFWVQALTGLHEYTRNQVHTVLTDLDRQWFDSVGRFYGGHSDEEPPVPIPNTEVKLVCVRCSTGVGDPLGATVRRHPFIQSARTHTRSSLGVFYLPPKSNSTLRKSSPTQSKALLSPQHGQQTATQPVDRRPQHGQHHSADHNADSTAPPIARERLLSQPHAR